MKWKLKTKLRLAIFGPVLVAVLAYSWVYVSLLTRQKFEASFDLGQYVTREIFHQADQTVKEAWSRQAELAPGDADSVRALARQALADNLALDALLESSIGYSYTISDAAIVDEDGRVLAHSESDKIGQRAPDRQPFQPLLAAGVLRQLAVAYGPREIYEISMDLGLSKIHFGSVRVGISTLYLRGELTPDLDRALMIVLLAVVLATVLAWLASSFLLRPLQNISLSLERMTLGQFDALPRPERQDEFGAVTTKLHLLGQQFRDAKESLAQVLHGLEEALLLFSRDGRVILASDAVKHFLGVEPADLLGRTVKEVFAADSPLSRAVLPALQQHRPVQRQEVQLQEIPPRRVVVNVQLIPDVSPEATGEPLASLVSLRDAESVRRLESEIEMSRRLAAISRLTRGVTHEVKNPLAAMTYHLEAMKAKLGRGNVSGVEKNLETIASEIYRLNRVVDTFLDFTRPVKLALQETELNGLVEEVVRLAEAEAGPRRVRIVFDPNGLSPHVRVDRDLIKQAILNIVLNGCQAMPHGGRLSITEQVHDEEVELSVVDQGPGIAPEHRERIFDLYFTTREKGSGIGLPLAFRAFQLHNGTIDFETEVGQGTTFRLRLPLVEKLT